MRRMLLGLAALLLLAASAFLGASPAPAAGAIVEFDFNNGAFTPSSATAHVGDQIGWCNKQQSGTIKVRLTDDSFETESLGPEDCDGFEATNDDIGTFTFECSTCSSPKPQGQVTIQAAPPTTTTTATAPATTTTSGGGGATTTTRRTTTTVRRVATATTRRAATTTTIGDTTTSEDTTTTFFLPTSTSEETTTTSGQLAINENSSKGNGLTFAVLGSLAVIAAGGGYLLWRYRNRFIR